MGACFGAYATDADDCLEVPTARLPHTVIDTELASRVRIARVSPLVDQSEHEAPPDLVVGITPNVKPRAENAAGTASPLGLAGGGWDTT